MSRLSRKEFIRLAALGGFAIANPKLLRGVSKFAPTKGPEYIDAHHPLYDELRQGFNKRISHAPSIIARCSSTEDVAGAIQYARSKSLSVAIKSGGHNFEGWSSNDGGLVIDLSQMNGVKLRENGEVEVGPASHLSQLYDALLPHKRIIPAGSCGTVGVGGLALGGGYGFFSRKYGLTCDSLIDATFVDANGQVHSAKDDAKLMWALRGGGTAGLGVVTKLVFASHPAPATFTSHHFKVRKLTPERASSLLETWFDATKQLPDHAFSAFVLNGKTLNILVTSYETETEGLRSALTRFKDFSRESHSSHPMPLSRALKQYYGRSEPLYFKNASAGLYKSFEDIRAAMPAVLPIVTSTPGMIYQVNTLGGAINDPSFESRSCYPHRAYPYLSELQTYWDSPNQGAHLITRFGEVQKLLRDHGVRAQYANYCATEFSDWQSAYYGDNYTGLQEVKRKYDPSDLFRHPQSIRI